MKTKLLTIFLLLVTIFSGCSKTEKINYNDLIINWNDNLYYKKFTDEPFSGQTYGVVQTKFVNGKYHGDYTSYWLDGSIHIRAKYKNGKRHGHYESYYSDGTPKLETTYQNDRPQGKLIYYNKKCETCDSYLEYELTIKGKKIEGTYVWFHGPNDMYLKYSCSNGRLNGDFQNDCDRHGYNCEQLYTCKNGKCFEKGTNRKRNLTNDNCITEFIHIPSEYGYEKNEK